MTPESFIMIQFVTQFIMLVVVMVMVVVVVSRNSRCCRELEARLAALEARFGATLSWIHDHHAYHDTLGPAVCQLEEKAMGNLATLANGTRLCPDPPGGGDGYGIGDPPPL